MKQEENEIENWIHSFDNNINAKSYAKYGEDLANLYCEKLVLSVVKKVAALEGVKRANESLKYTLGIEAEIETRVLEEEINKINDYELKVLALTTANLSKETKKRILDLYNINILEEQDKKRPRSLRDLLEKEVAKVYESVGELPNRDINAVNLVRDRKRKR